MTLWVSSWLLEFQIRQANTIFAEAFTSRAGIDSCREISGQWQTRPRRGMPPTHIGRARSALEQHSEQRDHREHADPEQAELNRSANDRAMFGEMMVMIQNCHTQHSRPFITNAKPQSLKGESKMS
ncbi:MAG: hypothetical protein JSR25_15725 [Proteobacteria bacterium]|nr:hypothetical protein [Pseudomonadota bacterium]